MSELWRRLPVVLKAVLTGALVASAGTLPWAALVALNTKHGSTLPWAVPPMAVYLWLFWRYVRGAGWPRSTAAARRDKSRANPVSEGVLGMALLAGIVGLAAVLLLQGVLSRLVTLPQQKDLDISKFPLPTVLFWILMSSIVAGVVEETAFRGYMQQPIERRHGPILAILLSGGLFGFAHFMHPEVTLVLLPYYIALAAVYGGLAYFTNSTLPSMMLHAGGNMLGAFNLFATGRSEWQAAANPKPLIWETGADASFWMGLVAAVGVGAIAVFAYAALAKAAQEDPAQRARQAS